MKTSISRTKLFAMLALFLIASSAVSFSLISTVGAHTPVWQIPTFAYIQATPNPIGVNQAVTIFMWIDKVFPSASNLGASANNIRPFGYTLTITAPDGTSEKQYWPVCIDPTSNQAFIYHPTKVGTYSIKFEYAGQIYNWTGTYQNDVYLPSSTTATFTVQSTPLAAPVNYGVPREYWTRPINGENTDWWKYASNWLGIGSPGMGAWGSASSATLRMPLNDDAVGPTSSHVMWTKPLQAGGVVGGNTYSVQGQTFFEGSAYVNRYTNPIIVNGMIYYTKPLSFSSASGGATECVDLRTGELIWSTTDIPALSFAYCPDMQWVNNHGVFPPILFTSNFARAFDAETGINMFNVTGVPSGTLLYGPEGELVKYVMNNVGNTSSPDYRLGLWNSSRMWFYTGFSPSIDTTTTTTYALVNTTGYVNNVKTVTSQNVSTVTTAVNASIFNSSDTHNRYEWNVTIPWRNTMTSAPTVVATFYNDVMICRNGSLPALGTSTPYTYFAVNLNPNRGQIGSVMWWKTYTAPAGNYTIYNGGADQGERVFVEMYKETMQWVGYSMDTGAKVWGPTASQAPMDYYGQPYYPILCGQVAYGKLYSSAYAGLVYCYSMRNGSLLWTYGNGGKGNSTNGGFEIPYGNYPTFVAAVGQGRIYLITTEHTVSTPIYKGAQTRCIDAETGKELWTLDAYTGTFSQVGYAIADGFANYFNGYDNQIYTIGKGPSSTTVDAPMAAVQQGGSIVIRGSVMDISAGTKQSEQAARFPHGVPAMSDSDMKTWMEYVYMHRQVPTDVKGVNVKVVVYDPNNNYAILNATTDTLGQFGLQFKPPVPGKYNVVATFEGSESYWPSTAETTFAVDPAATPNVIVTSVPAASASPTPASTQTQQPSTATPSASASPSAPNSPQANFDSTIYAAVAAIAVIVVVAIAAVALRKRK